MTRSSTTFSTVPSRFNFTWVLRRCGACLCLRVYNSYFTFDSYLTLLFTHFLTYTSQRGNVVVCLPELCTVAELAEYVTVSRFYSLGPLSLARSLFFVSVVTASSSFPTPCHGANGDSKKGNSDTVNRVQVTLKTYRPSYSINHYITPVVIVHQPLSSSLRHFANKYSRGHSAMA